MRQATAAELRNEVERLTRTLAVYEETLTLVMRTTPDAMESYRDFNGDRVTIKLYGAKRACGGVVIQEYGTGVHRFRGEPQYLMDVRVSEHDPLEWRQAISRIRVAAMSIAQAA